MIADPMNVVFLTHYGMLYGANRSMIDLMRGLRETQGIAPHVIAATDGPLLQELDALAIPHAVVPFKPGMHRPVYMGGPHHRLGQWFRQRSQMRTRSRHGQEMLPRLVARCRAWQADLIHVNSSVITLGNDLGAALHVPWVWHVRELQAHFGSVPDGGRRSYVRHMRRADAVIALSAAVRNELRDMAGYDLPVQVVHNGVFTDAQLQALAGRADERWSMTVPFTFVLVGVFHPSKGQLQAVDALAAVRQRGVDARLVLVGDGDTAAVRERIGILGLAPHITITGFVPDPLRYVGQAHCALTCSHHEAFGRATVEAMASGIPVIGHRSGGTPELIDEGATGLLYDTFDQLVAHMCRMATDPDLARRMGDQALHAPIVHHTAPKMSAQVARIYSAVMERRSH